jgi:phosphosulfolactate synthase (CoM biosynthesis protein A)
MPDQKTMIQTEIRADGVTYLLAQDQDLGELKRRIEDAIATAGRFVDFVVVGNRQVSLLVTPRSQVSIAVATVLFDARDTGDVDFPYGGHYDLL